MAASDDLADIFDELEGLAAGIVDALEPLVAQLAAADGETFTAAEVAARAERALARQAELSEALVLLRVVLGAVR